MGETSSESPVTAEWLTGVLLASGALPHGSVESVEMLSARPTLLSTVGRVAVRCSTAVSAPSHFFFKGTRPDLSTELRAVGRRAGRPRVPAGPQADLVEPSRAHHARLRRPRLRGIAVLS